MQYKKRACACLCVCVCLQMFDWIRHNKEVFLQSHTEIGRGYQHAVELQTQHNHFAMNSMVATVMSSQPNSHITSHQSTK